MRLVLASCVLLWASVACDGKTTTASVNNDDRVWIMLAKPFAFGSVGAINIRLDNVKVRWPESISKDYSDFGIYLADSKADGAQVQPSLEGDRCAFLKAAEGVEKLCGFDEPELKAIVTTPGSKSNFTLAKEMEGRQGIYSLIFANCVEDAVVSFDVRVKMYNEDADGEPNFLSVGEQELPLMYLCMCVVFTCGVLLWCWTMYEQRANTHAIHYLMALLGLFKVLTLLTQAGLYHFTQLSGSPDGWNVAYYIFTFFRGVMFFSVVVLIGTGWSYMKPFLGSNEKKILIIVIPLQVLANVAIIVMSENTPANREWFTWRDIMHLIDIICCCAVLFPIVWSIKHLRDAARTDGKAARSVKKLTLFRQFYVLVVIYIYFTRIVVYLLQTTLPYQHVWENPYLELDETELEAAGIYRDD